MSSSRQKDKWKIKEHKELNYDLVQKIDYNFIYHHYAMTIKISFVEYINLNWGIWSKLMKKKTHSAWSKDITEIILVCWWDNQIYVAIVNSGDIFGLMPPHE